MKGKHILTLVLITALTSAFVWVRIQIVNISYEIHTLEQQENSLREEITLMNQKIDEKKSPHHLELLANKKFNMHKPRPDQMVILSGVQKPK